MRDEKKKQRALKRKFLESTSADGKNLRGFPSWFRTKIVPEKMSHRFESVFRTNCRKKAEASKQSLMDKNADPTESEGIWGTSFSKKVPESKVEVKKTPAAPMQYKFGFEFLLNYYKKGQTFYSEENQRFIAKILHTTESPECVVSHEVQKGPKKGSFVFHRIFFNKNLVITSTGTSHKFLCPPTLGRHAVQTAKINSKWRSNVVHTPKIQGTVVNCPFLMSSPKTIPKYQRIQELFNANTVAAFKQKAFEEAEFNRLMDTVENVEKFLKY